MCINIFEGLKKWKTLIGRGELLLLNGCLGSTPALRSERTNGKKRPKTVTEILYLRFCFRPILLNNSRKLRGAMQWLKYQEFKARQKLQAAFPDFYLWKKPIADHSIKRRQPMPLWRIATLVAVCCHQAIGTGPLGLSSG